MKPSVGTDGTSFDCEDRERARETQNATECTGRTEADWGLRAEADAPDEAGG